MATALCIAAAVTAFSGASSASGVVQRRAPLAAVSMGGNKKVYSFEGVDGGLLEAREVSITKPPVYLLTRLNEMKVATGLAESGLLSAAEEAGVFSKLESAGAFSTAEKLLPLVEKFKLLSLFEELLEVEAGLLFTAANFLIVFTPVVLTLQICGFVPFPQGPVIPVEALACLSTGAAGFALFATAFIIGNLQESAGP
ncbi:hypothetical protein EMIHUDRAFT_121818, partial [Emiliania huxleyi CCMP1516]|uniref:Uncharacterized protein n=2 Tax=Emiliania huxleyi TaxID=2903 RepID=A0A0D3KYX5_EMIH1